MVPGLKTPLTFLRICFLTVCFLAPIPRTLFMSSLASVGSSTLISVSSLTTISAEIETSLKRTSICGSVLPSAFSIREATWSWSACGPCAMSVLPLSYLMVARIGWSEPVGFFAAMITLGGNSVVFLGLGDAGLKAQIQK
ncbi:hypothetical protein Pcac1_g28818 [Phytophthora cactorum]|nr:hypothetical protein Pcac1_g28818 [Phytophthora cactorum]